MSILAGARADPQYDVGQPVVSQVPGASQNRQQCHSKIRRSASASGRL